LVVLSSHSVQCWVELFGLWVHTLVCLLKGERNPTTLKVNVDDLDECVVTDVDDLFGQINVAYCKLGDVHEAFNAVFDTHKRTEWDELGDLTWNNLPDRVGAGEGLPWVFLGCLQRQGHTLTVEVD